MAVSDPRQRYDDLLEWRVEEAVDAATFVDYREMEAYRSGWVATGLVFDDDGRLLLAYAGGDEQHWLVPGGTLQPGESLAAGLRREVREETGVEARLERPRAVCDVVTTNEDAASEDALGFTVVFAEATAETTAVGDDLGVGGEAITDADWFAALPEDVYNRDGTADVLAACDRWDG